MGETGLRFHSQPLHRDKVLPIYPAFTYNFAFLLGKPFI